MFGPQFLFLSLFKKKKKKKANDESILLKCFIEQWEEQNAFFYLFFQGLKPYHDKKPAVSNGLECFEKKLFYCKEGKKEI